MNKNGGNVSKVCNETGAHIIFPIPEDKDQELLTIKGTEKAVKDAQKGLAALITNLDNIVEEDILINPVYHHHFFMRRGPVFREITEEYGGVSINFSYSGKQRSKVTIKGAKPCVEAAKKHIQEITGDLDSQVTTECIIPQKFHHFIMGQMCSRIQQITRDYNVQIKFPDKENSVTNMDPTIQKNEEEVREKSTTEAASISPRKCDTILISGQKEECAAAMEALEALIPVTAELDVPFDLHHYIIGQKRREIRKIMDRFEVNIHMSTPGLASDILFITGLAANVEQAKARLQELVKALQNEAKDRALRNFKLKFTVDPKYHPKIIGHKGVVITQICLKHKVAIHFPRKGSDETQDQITITGYENNTIAAQNAIMKLQIPVNHRVHGQVIGFHGKTVHKIMNQFQVDIHFSSRRSQNRNVVTVTGLPNNVTKATAHILNLEKHYLAVIKKHESQQEPMKKISLCNLSYTPSKDFVVKDLPRTANTTEIIPDINTSEDFPSLGNQIPPEKLTHSPLNLMLM
uniref:Vigilin n=1 Tax=Equus caballus TaxID=9796 RepID=A0A3Q2IJ18_HORSE